MRRRRRALQPSRAGLRQSAPGQSWAWPRASSADGNPMLLSEVLTRSIDILRLLLSGGSTEATGCVLSVCAARELPTGTVWKVHEWFADGRQSLIRIAAVQTLRREPPESSAGRVGSRIVQPRR